MKRRIGPDDITMANGIRLRNDHLTLEYRPDKPMLKSIGKATHHLAKLGIRRADGDFLQIEEALFLAELGAAVVQDQRRIPLTIMHLFSLLCSMNVSLFRYAVYAQLVRAGYVVRRSSDVASSNAHSQPSSTYAVKACAFHFSQQLLDQFPCIIPSSDERLAVSLHLPPIQAVHEDSDGGTSTTDATTVLLKNDAIDNNNSKDGIDGDEHDKRQCVVTLADLNVQMNAHIRKIENLLLRDVRRQHSEPWKCCRPRWWPSLRSLHDLDSWRVYALRRDALLQKRRNQQHQNRQPTVQRQSEWCLTYELFPDERSCTKPIYSVIIIEPFAIPGVASSAQPNFGELYKLATECKSRGTQLLVATGTPNCVKINEFVAESDETLCVPRDD